MGERADQSSELDATLDSVQLNDGEEVEDDNDLALKGIQMLLNNKMDDSAALFEKYRAHSVIMHYGGAFINYMQGMLFVSALHYMTTRAYYNIQC